MKGAFTAKLATRSTIKSSTDLVPTAAHHHYRLSDLGSRNVILLRTHTILIDGLLLARAVPSTADTRSSRRPARSVRWHRVVSLSEPESWVKQAPPLGHPMDHGGADRPGGRPLPARRVVVPPCGWG